MAKSRAVEEPTIPHQKVTLSWYCSSRAVAYLGVFARTSTAALTGAAELQLLPCSLGSRLRCLAIRNSIAHAKARSSHIVAAAVACVCMLQGCACNIPLQTPQSGRARCRDIPAALTSGPRGNLTPQCQIRGSVR